MQVGGVDSFIIIPEGMPSFGFLAFLSIADLVAPGSAMWGLLNISMLVFLQSAQEQPEALLFLFRVMQMRVLWTEVTLLLTGMGHCKLRSGCRGAQAAHTGPHISLQIPGEWLLAFSHLLNHALEQVIPPES